MRASRGMGIIMPSKCCSKVLSRPSACASKPKKSYKKGGTVKDACYKKVKASYKVIKNLHELQTKVVEHELLVQKDLNLNL